MVTPTGLVIYSPDRADKFFGAMHPMGDAPRDGELVLLFFKERANPIVAFHGCGQKRHCMWYGEESRQPLSLDGDEPYAGWVPCPVQEFSP